MIIAIDVYYKESAKTVAVAFTDWESEEIIDIKETYSEYSSEYVPGEFYKRELPCILNILQLFDKTQIDLIIVDGYVMLNDEGKLGLGGHLYESLNRRIPIIGVAKNRFSKISSAQIEIKRGESKNPLFITSIGIDLEEAADLITNMNGNYRIPDLLRLLDQKSKE